MRLSQTELLKLTGFQAESCAEILGSRTHKDRHYRTPRGPCNKLTGVRLVKSKPNPALVPQVKLPGINIWTLLLLTPPKSPPMNIPLSGWALQDTLYLSLFYTFFLFQNYHSLKMTVAGSREKLISVTAKLI